MTIVKPSKTSHRRSSIDLSLKRAKTLAKNARIVDVFSNSQLPGMNKNKNVADSESEDSYESEENSEDDQDSQPAPK